VNGGALQRSCCLQGARACSGIPFLERVVHQTHFSDRHPGVCAVGLQGLRLPRICTTLWHFCMHQGPGVDAIILVCTYAMHTCLSSSPTVPCPCVLLAPDGSCRTSCALRCCLTGQVGRRGASLVVQHWYSGHKLTRAHLIQGKVVAPAGGTVSGSPCFLCERLSCCACWMSAGHHEDDRWLDGSSAFDGQLLGGLLLCRRLVRQRARLIHTLISVLHIFLLVCNHLN